MTAVLAKAARLLSLALGLSGCTGNLIAGVPLSDAGPELSVDDAAASSPPAAGEGARSESDAEASAPVSEPPSEGDGGRGETADSSDDVSQGNDEEAAPDPGGPAPPAGDRDLSANPEAFFGESRCAQADALLCDGFEREEVGAGPDGELWSAPFGALPKVDATRAARGEKSLYFELAAGSPGHIEQRETFPAPQNTIYGRMFVWLDALPTEPAYASWTLVSALGSDDATEVRLGGQLDPTRENANYFGIGSDHGESGDWATGGREPLSRARAREWICLEWLFKGDTSETRVWIDGEEQESLHLTSTEFRAGDQEGGKRFVHPSFDRLRIGWWLYQPEATPSPAKLWIDEVVVDDERIGCAL